jgi:hypothetical protein
MKPKITYWLPTERSPWAVIYRRPKGVWKYLGFRERRSNARSQAEFVRQSDPGTEARVVRAWIPLK